jgi:hypothetical protein
LSDKAVSEVMEQFSRLPAMKWVICACCRNDWNKFHECGLCVACSRDVRHLELVMRMTPIHTGHVVVTKRGKTWAMTVPKEFRTAKMYVYRFALDRRAVIAMCDLDLDFPVEVVPEQQGLEPMRFTDNVKAWARMKAFLVEGRWPAPITQEPPF